MISPGCFKQLQIFTVFEEFVHEDPLHWPQPGGGTLHTILSTNAPHDTAAARRTVVSDDRHISVQYGDHLRYWYHS